MNTDMHAYYAHRAQEYEKVYTKPERQQNIQQLSSFLKDAFSGKSVYEVACGTGYWTQYVSKSALNILATDVNEEVLQIARNKNYHCPVSFEKKDMYLNPPTTLFTSCFGGFIWSHIPREKLVHWLDTLHQTLAPKSRCIFIDNHFVAGSNTPIHHTDAKGNTFQKRVLVNGDEYMVLKNFPTDQEMQILLASKATNIQIRRLDYFWILDYQLH